MRFLTFFQFDPKRQLTKIANFYPRPKILRLNARSSWINL